MIIGNKDLSDSGKDILIIAELSANHNGDLEVALETIRAAKRAGADAIKFQTYTADTMTIKSNRPDFKITSGTIWDGYYLHDLYQEAYTPWEWHKKLFECAEQEGLICFSSPFDKSAVDFLEDLKVPAYKIASFEITDIPLIEYVASKQKPIIISTGIATYEDIQLAVDTCRNQGNEQIALLKCTSSYPAPLNEANLSMIPDLKNKFNVIAGLSDHTLGLTAPIVSTALGARIIEKHFILDKSIGGPDSSFSLDEKEFKDLVNSVKQAYSSIGVVSYDLTEKQKSGRVFSRSLYITEDVKKGELLNTHNLRSIRPGFGMHPKFYNNFIGKPSPKDFSKGDRFNLD